MFATKADHSAQEAKEREMDLLQEILRLKMELKWMKRKHVGTRVEERLRVIEPQHPNCDHPAVGTSHSGSGQLPPTVVAGKEPTCDAYLCRAIAWYSRAVYA